MESPTRPSPTAGEALQDHLLAIAHLARECHGPEFNGGAVRRLLRDARIVRYPTRLRFDAALLQPGEFAYAHMLGPRAADGFELLVHPLFEASRDSWAPLMLYHIPVINYGEIVGPHECELFGATVLGTTVQEYYRRLCDLADTLESPT